MRAGVPEGALIREGDLEITKGMVPSPMGMGRNLITAGGRELANRVGLPALRKGFIFDDFLDFIPMGFPQHNLPEVPPQLSLEDRRRLT